MIRDVASIPKYERRVQDSGSVAYFFGDTAVVVDECKDENGFIRLIPKHGDQVACGEWYDLWPEALEEYCRLLEKEINK